MEIVFSETQRNRLGGLGLKLNEMEECFVSMQERETRYKQLEKDSVAKNRNQLIQLTDELHQPMICKLQQDLTQRLILEGFTQVTTPTIISKKFLERMSINEMSPLHQQVFWLDQKTCLRPMLAPNLYDISEKLLRYSKLPLRIFEIGSCFRKESEGRAHLKEFTMLNLVEWGTPEESRVERLKELAAIVLQAAHLKEYGFEEEDSVVYGLGLDVVSSDGIELASTSMGPHPLDHAWKISCSWVGIGFGLERLLMVREGEEGIHRHSKSTSFLNGTCLNIK